MSRNCSFVGLARQGWAGATGDPAFLNIAQDLLIFICLILGGSYHIYNSFLPDLGPPALTGGRPSWATIYSALRIASGGAGSCVHVLW